jgi:asparagine synthase (glutamine-hydrolysing)
MTEKYVLRGGGPAGAHGDRLRPAEASIPGAARGERLYELVQDTLRGPLLTAMPFYDPAKVFALLEGLPALGDAARTAFDPVLMIILSACCMQQRYFQ